MKSFASRPVGMQSMKWLITELIIFFLRSLQSLYSFKMGFRRKIFDKWIKIFIIEWTMPFSNSCRNIFSLVILNQNRFWAWLFIGFFFWYIGFWKNFKRWNRTLNFSQNSLKFNWGIQYRPDRLYPLIMSTIYFHLPWITGGVISVFCALRSLRSVNEFEIRFEIELSWFRKVLFEFCCWLSCCWSRSIACCCCELCWLSEFTMKRNVDSSKLSITRNCR